MTIYNYLVTFLIAIVTAVVTALVTAKLSLKGFYRQELWLRKESEYNNIINSLCSFQKYYSDTFDYGTDVKPRSQKPKDTNEQFIRTLREIEILSYYPSYMIDKRVYDILKRLVEKETGYIDDYIGHCNDMYRIVNDVLTEISEYAKDDLRIK